MSVKKLFASRINTMRMRNKKCPDETKCLLSPYFDFLVKNQNMLITLYWEMHINSTFIL